MLNELLELRAVVEQLHELLEEHYDDLDPLEGLSELLEEPQFAYQLGQLAGLAGKIHRHWRDQDGE